MLLANSEIQAVRGNPHSDLSLENFCRQSFSQVSAKCAMIALLLVDDQSLYLLAKSTQASDFVFYSQPESVIQQTDIPLGDCYAVIHGEKTLPHIAPIFVGNQIRGLLVVEQQAHNFPFADILKPLPLHLDNYCLHLKVIDSQQQLLRQEGLLQQAQQQNLFFSQLLKELHQLTIELSKLDSLDELYHYTVKAGISRLGIDRMALFIMDKEQDTYYGTYGTTETGDVADESYFQNKIPNVPFVQEALTRKDYLSIWHNASILHNSQEIGVGWNAMVALWHGDETIGWIACDNFINKQPLGDHQKEVLILLAASVAQMIMRKQAEEQVIQLNKDLELRVRERTAELAEAYQALSDANNALRLVSSMDSLTGLANRREFDEHLDTQWSLALKQKSSLSLIMIDVDFFKQYNDTFGHQEGDVCLQQIANELKSCINEKSDLIARYGGEEIVLLCPELTTAQTAAMAEMCRKKIARLNISHPVIGIEDKVTISAGYVCLTPVNGMPNKNIIRIADQALYQAKQTGRNNTVQAMITD
ncbi:diguanylate cyclase domain-containing protein [Motilimonas pumila]|uniref:diguanylate cyclase n=1 Tax=Motilimonas pumila TaxID=2303987 RepID=A0A418YJ49_9GAMM|nr:diguanylate cyclase [Motilimonas pumila]RJG50675.1 diguanylate cyclase [Motilimonas pumila]